MHHEPESITCACGCALQRIGRDVAEKLDYVPGVFTVERHIRGEWACAICQTLMQAPVPAQMIGEGIPTAGLLAQVWWPSTLTTCRCTASRGLLLAPALPFPAPRWEPQLAPAAFNCSRWSTRLMR